MEIQHTTENIQYFERLSEVYEALHNYELWDTPDYTGMPEFLSGEMPKKKSKDLGVNHSLIPDDLVKNLNLGDKDFDIRLGNSGFSGNNYFVSLGQLEDTDNKIIFEINPKTPTSESVIVLARFYGDFKSKEDIFNDDMLPTVVELFNNIVKELGA